MVIALRIFFGVVLASMLGVTSWAGMQVPLWDLSRSVGGHPWFVATLVDTYWAFFTFYVWVCYKETAPLARGLWFLAIVALGNMAMAAYGLAVTVRLPATAAPAEILLRGKPVSPAIPAFLLAALALVSAIAALS